jgi:ribosomal protein L24E
MSNIAVSAQGGEGVCCFCGRSIPAGAWFARIHAGDQVQWFCRPRCVEKHLEIQDPRLREPEPIMMLPDPAISA